MPGTPTVRAARTEKRFSSGIRDQRFQRTGEDGFAGGRMSVLHLCVMGFAPARI